MRKPPERQYSKDLDEKIQVRVTIEMYDEINRRACRERVSLAEYTRRLLTEALDDTHP